MNIHKNANIVKYHHNQILFSKKKLHIYWLISRANFKRQQRYHSFKTGSLYSKLSFIPHYMLLSTLINLKMRYILVFHESAHGCLYPNFNFWGGWWIYKCHFDQRGTKILSLEFWGGDRLSKYDLVNKVFEKMWLISPVMP